MAVYNLAQLIGKTFFGTKDIEIRRVGVDSAKIIYTVKKGQALGKLTSWLNANSYRDSIWLEFVDVYNIPFYVKLEEGKFSLSKLIEQGAISVQEQIELDKQTAEETAKDGFDKTKEIVQYLLYGVGIWAGVTVIKTLKS